MENRKVAAPGEYQAQIRARLGELRDEHGLSEIARRTQTPLTNVHRYVREGKIPAEFCAALVDAFEASPAWLLTGSGGTLLTDVDPDTARLGGNMLELMNAMNAVSRMRLGALAGKAQQKTLRELGEALDTHERLRERMNEQTRPLLEELIRRFNSYCRSMQLDRAAEVRAAAQQVARFCTDDDLLWNFDQMQAEHEHLRGRVEAGLRIHKKLFARKLHEGIFGDEACQEAAHLVLALRDSARFVEALRICKAAIHLAVDEARAGRVWTDLQLIAGSLEVDLGNVAEGIARMQAGYRATHPNVREFAAMMLLRGELLADYRNPDEARSGSYRSRPRSRILLRHAAMLEDAGELGILARENLGDEETLIPRDDYDGRRVILLNQIFTKKRGDPVAEFEKFVEESPPRVNSPQMREVVINIHRAQIARCAGAKAAARARTLETHKSIERVPPDRTMTIELKAVHARNVLECLSPKSHAALRDAALATLKQNLDLGFGCLRNFVPS